MNNSSMLTADRMTHLKIVVLSLICATLVAGVGIAARVTDGSVGNVRMEATVIKAGTPVQASTTDSNGFYSLSEFPGSQGRYLWVSKKGYRADELSVTITTDTRLDLELQRQ